MSNDSTTDRIYKSIRIIALLAILVVLYFSWFIIKDRYSEGIDRFLNGEVPETPVPSEAD